METKDIRETRFTIDAGSQAYQGHKENERYHERHYENQAYDGHQQTRDNKEIRDTSNTRENRDTRDAIQGNQ